MNALWLLVTAATGALFMVGGLLIALGRVGDFEDEVPPDSVERLATYAALAGAVMIFLSMLLSYVVPA